MADPIPQPIALAEWADWFCRNVKDPQDFRWIHMAKMANQLKQLYKQLDTLQKLADDRLDRVIELEGQNIKLLRLPAELQQWKSVFGHLGTADECGNEWLKLHEQQTVLLTALKKISAIENQEYGADWEEIEEARKIADAAIEKVEKLV